MNTFSGFRVIESVYLTEKGEPREVRRSWRERLFSRPWQPLRATRIETPLVPSKTAVKLNAHTIVIHPETLRQLKRSIEGRP